MAKQKQRRSPDAEADQLVWLCNELRIAIEKGWWYIACVTYGQLLEAVRLFPSAYAEGVLAQTEGQLRDLLTRHLEALAAQIAEKADHVTKIVTSGYGLVAEEFVLLGSYLSDWVALHDALQRLGL